MLWAGWLTMCGPMMGRPPGWPIPGIKFGFRSPGGSPLGDDCPKPMECLELVPARECPGCSRCSRWGPEARACLRMLCMMQNAKHDHMASTRVGGCNESVLRVFQKHCQMALAACKYLQTNQAESNQEMVLYERRSSCRIAGSPACNCTIHDTPSQPCSTSAAPA